MHAHTARPIYLIFTWHYTFTIIKKQIINITMAVAIILIIITVTHPIPLSNTRWRSNNNAQYPSGVYRYKNTWADSQWMDKKTP